MRYNIRKNTLFIRGSFKAASTGIKGGISDITTVLNHTVPRSFSHENPGEYLGNLIKEEGYDDDFFGMLTAVKIKNLCVLSYDYITVFITAGVSNPNPKGPNTINIIIHSRETLSDGALLEMIITATEAKAEALRSMGYDFTGTTTDEVAVLFDREDAQRENETVHEYAGTLTDAGSKVYACVKNGVPEAIKRHEEIIPVKEPSFFIFTTKDGVKMNLWEKKGCPYYPCHFKGQNCDLCYCPFYPCLDETLGDRVMTSSGKEVWSCKRCLINHYPETVRYIKNNPDAELSELKKYASDLDLKLTE